MNVYVFSFFRKSVEVREEMKTAQRLLVKNTELANHTAEQGNIKLIVRLLINFNYEQMIILFCLLRIFFLILVFATKFFNFTDVCEGQISFYP